MMDKQWLAIVGLIFMPALALGGECVEQEMYEEDATQRKFYSTYYGPTVRPGTRESAGEAIGDCIGLDEHGANALEFFSGFGLDLRLVQDDPYQTLDSDHFYFTHYDEAGDFTRVNAATSAHFAKVVRKRSPWSEFYVKTKRPTWGPRGNMTEGSSVSYGRVRFVMGHTSECMTYWSEQPVPPPLVDGMNVPYLYQISHDTWGTGTLSCAVISLGDYTSVSGFFTFPVVVN